MKIAITILAFFLFLKAQAQISEYLIIDTVEADYFLVYVFHNKLNNDMLSPNFVFLYSIDNEPILNRLSDVYTRANGLAIQNLSISDNSVTTPVKEIKYKEFKVNNIYEKNKFRFHVLKVHSKFMRICVKQTALRNTININSDNYLYKYYPKTDFNMNYLVIYVPI